MASTSPAPEADGASSDDKSITLEVLKAHTTREDLWILLHDKVYNVTQFLDEHPGGDEVLLEEAGRDATEAFEDVGHSDEARALLPKMLLGEFKGEKTTKAKKAASNAQTAARSSSSFPIWVVPAAAFAVYIAWRVIFA